MPVRSRSHRHVQTKLVTQAGEQVGEALRQNRTLIEQLPVICPLIGLIGQVLTSVAGPIAFQ